MIEFSYPKNFLIGIGGEECVVPLPLGGWLVNGIIDGYGVRLLVSSDGRYRLLDNNFIKRNNTLLGLRSDRDGGDYFIGGDGLESSERILSSCFKSSELFDLLVVSGDKSKEVIWLRKIYGANDKNSILVLFSSVKTKEVRALSFCLSFKSVYSYSLSCDGLTCLVLGMSYGFGCVTDNPLL